MSDFDEFQLLKNARKKVVRVSMFEGGNLTFSLSQKNLTFCVLLLVGKVV